jgi:hypothetical protein
MDKAFPHALLGIFAASAPAAAAALTALAKGDTKKFHKILDPTVPLSRLIFQMPTQYYKTGIVFLAWLNGHQEHFVMVNGAQSARPLFYFSEAFKLADQAGLLVIPIGGEADEKLAYALWPMMRRFAVNTATLGFQCPIEQSIDGIAAAGFGGIAPWRREIEGQNVSAIAKRIRDAGLKVTAIAAAPICRHSRAMDCKSISKATGTHLMMRRLWGQIPL